MMFDDWSGVIRVILIGVMVYPAVIIMLRISGKRTLSTMNMFDLVITVALGSTVATIILSPDVAFAEGAAALALLILLQFLVTWFEVRSKAFTSLIKGEPQLLFYEGKYMDTTLKKERLKTDEVRQAVRSEGILSMDEVEAVVLETNGSFSVIKKENAAGESSLKDLRD